MVDTVVGYTVVDTVVGYTVVDTVVGYIVVVVYTVGCTVIVDKVFLSHFYLQSTLSKMSHAHTDIWSKLKASAKDAVR